MASVETWLPPGTSHVTWNTPSHGFSATSLRALEPRSDLTPLINTSSYWSYSGATASGNSSVVSGFASQRLGDPTGSDFTTSWIGWPSTRTDPVIALDTFTGVNGTDIDTHTPDTGWTAWNRGVTDPGWAELSNNRLVIDGNTFGGNGLLVATGSIATTNYAVEALVIPPPLANFNSKAGVVLRCTSNGGSSATRQYLRALIQKITGGAGHMCHMLVERIDGAVGAEASPEEQVYVASNVSIQSLSTDGVIFRAVALGNSVLIYTRPFDLSSDYTLRGTASFVTALNTNSRFGLATVFATSSDDAYYDNFSVASLKSTQTDTFAMRYTTVPSAASTSTVGMKMTVRKLAAAESFTVTPVWTDGSGVTVGDSAFAASLATTIGGADTGWRTWSVSSAFTNWSTVSWSNMTLRVDVATTSSFTNPSSGLSFSSITLEVPFGIVIPSSTTWTNEFDLSLSTWSRLGGDALSWTKV